MLPSKKRPNDDADHGTPRPKRPRTTDHSSEQESFNTDSLARACQHGDDQEVDRLLKLAAAEGDDFNSGDLVPTPFHAQLCQAPLETTVFQYACENPNANVLILLLEEVRKYSPEDFAQRLLEVLTRTFGNKEFINNFMPFVSENLNSNAWHVICSENAIELVKLLFRFDTPTDEFRPGGETSYLVGSTPDSSSPIICAAEKKHTELLEIIFNTAARIDPHFFSIFHIRFGESIERLIRNRNHEVLRTLLPDGKKRFRSADLFINLIPHCDLPTLEIVGRYVASIETSPSGPFQFTRTQISAPGFLCDIGLLYEFLKQITSVANEAEGNIRVNHFLRGIVTGALASVQFDNTQIENLSRRLGMMFQGLQRWLYQYRAEDSRKILAALRSLGLTLNLYPCVNRTLERGFHTLADLASTAVTDNNFELLAALVTETALPYYWSIHPEELVSLEQMMERRRHSFEGRPLVRISELLLSLYCSSVPATARSSLECEDNFLEEIYTVLQYSRDLVFNRLDDIENFPADAAKADPKTIYLKIVDDKNSPKKSKALMINIQKFGETCRQTLWFTWDGEFTYGKLPATLPQDARKIIENQQDSLGIIVERLKKYHHSTYGCKNVLPPLTECLERIVAPLTRGRPAIHYAGGRILALLNMNGKLQRDEIAPERSNSRLLPLELLTTLSEYVTGAPMAQGLENPESYLMRLANLFVRVCIRNRERWAAVYAANPLPTEVDFNPLFFGPPALRAICAAEAQSRLTMPSSMAFGAGGSWVGPTGDVTQGGAFGSGATGGALGCAAADAYPCGAPFPGAAEPEPDYEGWLGCLGPAPAGTDPEVPVAVARGMDEAAAADFAPAAVAADQTAGGGYAQAVAAGAAPAAAQPGNYGMLPPGTAMFAAAVREEENLNGDVEAMDVDPSPQSGTYTEPRP